MARDAQKTILQFYGTFKGSSRGYTGGTFKGSSRGYTGGTFSYEAFSRFRRPIIGFVRKYETFVVFYKKIYKPLEFGTEPGSLP